ncbi:LOW QUALITY PROTEIN: sesquipedalian-1-like [Macrobrachium nipponense]|uniref:LOW QUALITY PROTEIN: sesquipedalian-1-like n=1 Tax=Macrobrachium nipponense TaxID=159736 RepID=UPI0030C7A84F
MKINEKNLCAYSISQTQIDKEGYLLKKGEVNKSFQRRGFFLFFVLKGNLLFYFEKKGDREAPIGSISFWEGCTIELAECEDQFTFKLLFYGGGGRTYVLAADSQESLELWMKALSRASHDYLKLMVAELQKQLDELTESERQGGDENGMYRPKAPPRQRQNPFNRTQSSNEVTLDPSMVMRMRANTVSGVGQYLSSAVAPQSITSTAPSVSHISIQKRTFAQLHSEYGVPILRDKDLQKLKKGKCDNSERSSLNASQSENVVVMDLIDI